MRKELRGGILIQVEMQVIISTVSFLLFYGAFLSVFLVNLILLTAAELPAPHTERCPPGRVQHCRGTASPVPWKKKAFSVLLYQKNEGMIYNSECEIHSLHCEAAHVGKK